MNAPPQKHLEPNVYFVDESMQSKSVGTLNNKTLLIKSIVVNLVLGNKNKMDQDLIPSIIPKGILKLHMLMCTFNETNVQW